MFPAPLEGGFFFLHFVVAYEQSSARMHLHFTFYHSVAPSLL